MTFPSQCLYTPLAIPSMYTELLGDTDFQGFIIIQLPCLSWPCIILLLALYPASKPVNCRWTGSCVLHLLSLWKEGSGRHSSVQCPLSLLSTPAHKALSMSGGGGAPASSAWPQLGLGSVHQVLTLQPTNEVSRLPSPNSPVISGVSISTCLGSLQSSCV